MVESIWKDTESGVEKLTRQQCQMLLEPLGMVGFEYLRDKQLKLSVLNAVLNGDLHPRDIKEIINMQNQVRFTVKFDVVVVLPMILVCKKTGNMETGERFCEIGKTYELTEVQHSHDIDQTVTFTVLTESWTDDGCSYLEPHYMEYDFLKEYFHVTF